MKKLLLSFFTICLFGNISFSQTTIYYIDFDSLVGMTLTSGDMCSAPFTIEEAHQTTAGNTWGGMWQSVNTGTATSIQVELSFTYSQTTGLMPSTLNGVPSNTVDPGADINCATGVPLTWVIDPTNYNSGGMNTVLFNFATSPVTNQIDNIIPHGNGYAYLKVTVVYTPSGVGINEYSNESEKKLLKVTDLLGRETKFESNRILIYYFSDGSTEKVFKTE